MNKLYSIFLVLVISTFPSVLLYSQIKNPQVLSQIQMMLEKKGLTQQEVINKLKEKGLNIELMSEDELIKNRPLIEQIVLELENSKKTSITRTDTVNQTSRKNIDSTSSNLKQSEEASERAQDSARAALTQSKIYGHKIFRDNSIQSYRISKDASPPDNYILAPGDKINVLIFGKSQADLQYEINAEGFIQPNMMPKIFLSGLTLKQGKDLLMSRISSYYSFNKDQFALTLNTSRTLTVNIFGEVEKSGSYTTSALNTALNALSVSGGPTEFGSVRNIEIIRGKTKKILDVYAFMRNPILQFDFFLQNNDIIYVPPAGKLVTIDGAVNRPMKYELQPNEGISELIDFAGGVKANTNKDLFQIKRYENNEIVLKDYSFNDVLSGKIKIDLRNGDIITVKEINSPFKNFVSVSGEVEYPGRYDYSSTNTVKKLIQKAKLLTQAKIDRSFLVRTNQDLTKQILPISIDSITNNLTPDFSLIQQDSLVIFNQRSYVDTFGISIIGEVRKPFLNGFRIDERITVNDAIELAGGLKNTAASYAYIYRSNPLISKSTQYIPIDLTISGTQQLQPGDKLVILNKDLYKLESSITITGDINKPTELRFDSGLSIKDLLIIGGGYTLSSDPSFVEIFRLNLNYDSPVSRSLIRISLDRSFNVIGSNFKLNPYDVVVVRSIPGFELQEIVTIFGEVKRPGPYVLKSKKYHFSDLITDAGGLTNFSDVYNISLLRRNNNIGQIAFNAIDALNSKGDQKYDPILIAGDEVSVSKYDNTVSISDTGTRYVLGKDQKSLEIIFQGTHSAKWYINNFAGGFSKNADRNSVQVLSKNGIVSKTRKFLFFRNFPTVRAGDKIRLNLKPPKEKNTKEGKEFDWDKFTARLISIFTLVALVRSFK